MHVAPEQLDDSTDSKSYALLGRRFGAALLDASLALLLIYAGSRLLSFATANTSGWVTAACRPDRRRITDLAAGTRVMDARS